jgi:GxxExxY protein
MAEIIYKELSYAIVGAAMEVHNILGPGFLEKVYQEALAHEFSLRGIAFEPQKPLPVYYKGVLVGDYQANFVVEDSVIVEIKALAALATAHAAQTRNYLAATGFRLAILCNFGEKSLHYERVTL